MKYGRILSYVMGEVWAIEPSKLESVSSFLALKAAGGDVDAETVAGLLAARGSALSAPVGGSVAVIPIRGTIAHRAGTLEAASGGTSTEAIGAMFRAAMADESVGTILFDVDSPGGTVTGVPELADELFEARGRKRMVALVNGMAASAAYWLASQADEVVSIPSGVAGSIGVYTAHHDVSEALAKEGIKVTLVSAGKHKVSGNSLEPLSDDEKAVLQGRVDAAYRQFVSSVARGRQVSAEDVMNGYGEGRAVDAAAAVAAGLVDRVETVSGLFGRLLPGPVMGLRAEAEAPALEPAPVEDGRRRRVALL